VQTKRMGDVTIDRVGEIDRYLFAPQDLLPGLDHRTVERYRSILGPRLVDFETNKLIISFHSYVIRLPGRTILVDTCNGNHKERPGKPWQHMHESPAYLSNLAKIGVRPEDVDVVLCTHLHGDHVGWNTRLSGGRWVPTFPNARYLMSRRDYEHFSALTEGPPEARRPTAAFADSVLPIIEAGRAELIDVPAQAHPHLDDRVWLEPSPGHTPGHMTVHVRGGAARAVLVGDVIHHPIQFHEPDLSNNGDVDPVQARHTRERLLQLSSETHALFLTAHFPAPTAGHVRAIGDRFTFEFDAT